MHIPDQLDGLVVKDLHPTIGGDEIQRHLVVAVPSMHELGDSTASRTGRAAGMCTG
jgi:hypothetical protein